MKNKIYFLENDFGIEIENKIIINKPYKYIKSFYQRIITNIYYTFKLFFVGRNSIIIAPWGLFIIPAILNKLFYKNFYIISLTCDTFLSSITLENKNNSFLDKIKYSIAKFTYKEPKYFIYCSEVVKEQLEKFGVQKEKIIYKYKEWIRYEDRYNLYKGFKKNDYKKNNFLFIGHCYNTLQKRLDILIDAYIELFSEFKDMSLVIIGGGWNDYFGNDTIKKLESYNILFLGYEYNIDTYIKEATYYIHPGEYEGFGVSVLEAMLSGCIPLVSNKTGAKEVVEKLGKDFVIPLSKNDFILGIKKLILLTNEEREKFGYISKNLANEYNYNKSRIILNQIITKLLNNI